MPELATPQLWTPPRGLLRPGRDFDIGLPRNGLVALYDPYRDVYGRNVLPSSVVGLFGGTRTTIETGQADSSGGTSGLKVTETTDNSTHYFNAGGANVACVAGAKYAYVMHVKPAGVSKVLWYPWVTVGAKGYVSFDLSGAGAIHASDAGACGTTGAITALGDGWYKLTLTFTADVSDNFTFGLLFYNDSWATSYAGSTDRALYVSHWQKYFNAVMPYSAPSGAPGTLQTSLDYSGNGNHLTLGATTGASTDDPVDTGTAWSFDGGDFLLTPDFGNGDLTAYTVFKMNETLSGATPILWGRNNAQLFWETADGKCAFAFRDSSSTSRATKVTGLSTNTWYLAGVRLSATGDWSLGVTSLGALSASGYTPHTTYSTWGDYLGRASTAYMEGSIAFHLFYNRVVADSEWMRIRQYINGLMAQRGIVLA